MISEWHMIAGLTTLQLLEGKKQTIIPDKNQQLSQIGIDQASDENKCSLNVNNSMCV